MTGPDPPNEPPAIPAPRSTGRGGGRNREGRLTRLASSLETSGVGADPEGQGVPYAGLRLAAVGAAAVGDAIPRSSRSV